MAKIPILIKEGRVDVSAIDELIIGIDLGTTNSLVAIAKDNKPEIIIQDGSSALVPSIIHFAEDASIIVGNEAKAKLIEAPERTIYSAKRLMGKSFNDLSEMHQHLAYEIIESSEEELVKVRVGTEFFTPIELSSKILAELKLRVEENLKRKVSKAVITVPAYFNDAQRQATRDAGKLAGLEVLRIVNEPTAASLAYGLGRADEDKIIAVYDLGGGTFDVSILNLQSGIFEVLSTNGDTFLGGDDFDQAIINFWISKYNLDFADLKKNKSLMQKFRISAEKAKKELTDADTFTIKIGKHNLTITKLEFESIIHELVERTINSCSAALNDAAIEKEEIDEIIMVGGSTRVPLVKKEVSKFFGKEVNDSIDPDQVVALGAAIQADILAGKQTGVLLLDITPLSLGIETMGGLMDTIIPRNSKIPAKQTRQYTTSLDGQTNLKITVFQGERDLVEHNRKLGEFILSGIPPMPAGLPKVDISFIIDADGVLLVKAKETRSNTNTAMTIKSQYGISEEEMAKMLMDSIQNAKSDMDARALLEAKNEGNSMLKSVEKFLKDNQTYLKENQVLKINTFISELKELISGKDKNLIHSKITEINNYTEPLANEALTRIIKNEISN